MFAMLADLEKTGVCTVGLTQDSRADLVGEFKQWLNMSAISQEGPGRRARHFAAVLTKGSSDASSVGWGSVVNTTSDIFPVGGVFPPDWLSKHINHKEMYALYHLLRQFCTGHPDVSRRAQGLIDVDSQLVVDVFNRGRAKNRETHSRVAGTVVRVAAGVRLYVVVEIDPDGGERGRGCHLAAVTKSHHPHSAGSVQSCLGRNRTV